MDACKTCYKYKDSDCKYCYLNNPCINYTDYDLMNDTCKSNGACRDSDKKYNEQIKE